MHFRAQRKSASDVSLSDYIETGKDGTALSLMDVKLHQVIGERLDEREKTVITLRYGMGNRQPMTQREVATLCGISRSYVSRIEKKALEKLEEALKE